VALLELALRGGDRFRVGVLLAQERQHVGGEHVELARGPKLARDPSELFDDPVPLVTRDDILEQRDRGAQAP
jgi:hypothetical protein